MNSLHELAQSPLVERLGWTLLHSVWQVLAVAACLAALLPAVRRRSAQASYLACCTALLVAFALPLLTFPMVTPSAPPRATIDPAVAPASVPVFSSRVEEAMPRTPAPPIIPSPETSASPSMGSSRGPQQALPAAAPAITTTAPTPTPSWSDRVADQAQLLQATLARQLPAIVMVWALGVAVFSLWNAGAWVSVQRLKSRSATPAPMALQQAAARIAGRLGVSRAVRILQSALVESPVVIGALKPVILLPASLATRLPADQLEALLAHELAHVVRHDYLVNLLQSVLETLMFYHPAVWWISSQVRQEREHCCDDVAVRVASNRTVYVQVLAAVAGARGPQTVPAANGGVLLPRLQRILGLANPHAVHSARWLTGLTTLLVIGGALALVSMSGGEAAATEQPAAPQQGPAALSKKGPVATTGESLRVRALDKAGKPLSQATIIASVWTDQKGFKKTREYPTDAEGNATVLLPKTLTILRLWAYHGGYVGKFVNFETNRRLTNFTVPKEYTFRLTPGTAIGGVVRDEEGRPIAGALVQPDIDYNAVDPEDKVRLSLSDAQSEGVKTDAEGRWKIADVPSTGVTLSVSHPNYLSDARPGEMQKAQNVTNEALLAGTAAIVMRRGLDVTGTVTDPEGKPVENALILPGDEPHFRREGQNFRTDAAGRYQLPPSAAGPLRVTVVAKGWMPDTRVVDVAAPRTTADFQLRPGKTLRLRFVDQAGKPVPKVYVRIDRWRKSQALYNYEHPGVQDTHIPRQADARGVFEWTWAPNDPVTYHYEQRGYGEADVSLAADGEEHVLTINPQLAISGTVRDAQTGQPIDAFLAMPLVHFRPDFSFVPRYQARRETQGRFRLELDRGDIEHGVQIEAFGYRLFRTSKRYRIGDADPELDVRLEPAPRCTGRLLSADGHPLSDANIYVATPYQHLDLDDLKDRDLAITSNYCVHPDEQGKFEIISQIEPYTLVVVAPEGYAELRRSPEQELGEIRLQAWAKVTGRLIQSGKPVANCQVTLHPIRFQGGDQPNISSGLYTTTGEDGSFRFERVPPVPCHVRGYLHFSRESPLHSSQSMPLRPAPGETIDVPLGGEGSDVSGQLVVENAPPDFDYHFSLSYLVARRPGIEPPEAVARLGFDASRGWSDAFRSTQEGQAILDTLHHYFVKPQPDGRIRISGVAPGDYDLAINLYGSTEGCLVHPVATRVIRLTVPEGKSSLDLGRLSIPSLPVPKVGDPAADLAVTTTDGAQLRLSSLRGQYVLLDFWASWCAPCLARLDDVEGLRRRYEAGGRLTVVGLNLDADAERAQQVLAQKPLPWRHALLGEWTDTDVPRLMGISSIPAYVLIDPEGRIVAHEFLFEKVAEKLDELLQK